MRRMHSFCLVLLNLAFGSYLILASGSARYDAPLFSAGLPALFARGFPFAPTLATAEEKSVSSAELTPGASNAEAAAGVAKSLSTAFERAATLITPSVVNIIATTKPKGPRSGQPKLDPFFERFREFFGDELGGPFQQPPNGGNGQQGLGTGVIVDDRGYILTNNHVVGDADEVTVRLHDQSTFKAEVVGKDTKTDLAVIKVKARDLASAKLGNSDDLKIGEWVIAAGNPFGLDNSITAGIVSAKGRSIMGGGQFEDFIQTDAAINPGNSGGPLVNLEGEVIGINTAIFSRSGGYMGIGFAIPINMAKNVMEDLIQKGRVVRGWLGVAIQNLTEDLAKSFDHQGTSGALVGFVQPEGPSHGALKQGDIIVSFDGKPIKDVTELRNLVAGTPPGKSIELAIVRDGQKSTAKVKIGELPSGSPEESVPTQANETTEKLGVTVENLTPQMARQLRTKRSKGVVVTDIDPGSAAASAGLAPQDIVVSIDRHPIESVNDFRTALSKEALRKGVRIVVETQGMERYVFLKSQD